MDMDKDKDKHGAKAAGSKAPARVPTRAARKSLWPGCGNAGLPV